LSLGEFTALTAAGAMSFEDGLRVVRQRGRFMQEACEATRGGMAASSAWTKRPRARFAPKPAWCWRI
jgi:acyl transferase domain-containing protein